MTKWYIVVSIVLEKEQMGPFSFIVVKKNCFAVTIGEFHDVNDILIAIQECNIPQKDCCWTIHIFGTLCMQSCFWKCMIYIALKVKIDGEVTNSSQRRGVKE